MKIIYQVDHTVDEKTVWFEWSKDEDEKMLAFFDKVGIDESSSFKRDLMLMKHIKSDEELKRFK